MDAYGNVFALPKVNGKDATDDDHKKVKFRVNDPFQTEADVFVRYEKHVCRFGKDVCEIYDNTVAGCDLKAPEINVGCIEYPNVTPFALVDVYFASKDSFVLSNADEVNKCCHPPDYSGFVVIKYAFTIECSCPSDAGNIRSDV